MAANPGRSKTQAYPGVLSFGRRPRRPHEPRAWADWQVGGPNAKVTSITAGGEANTRLTPAQAAVDEAAVQALAKKNGCTSCHAVDKSKTGPSYQKIAAKYKGKADGEDKIIKQITTGAKVKTSGSDEMEYKVIETKDPKELNNLAQWILVR